MARKRTRNLSPEEKQLWSRVTETAKPLQNPTGLVGVERPAMPTTPTPKKPLSLPRAAPIQRPQSLTGLDLAPDLQTRFRQQPVDMDAKLFRKMQSGRLSPQGRLDLHGMTLAQAHPKLIHFVQDAYQDEKRLVLVITGKGKHRDGSGPIPVRTGVLKHQVPQWLRQFPLGPLVLQIAPANQRHGGEGAIYVYLRRRR